MAHTGIRKPKTSIRERVQKQFEKGRTKRAETGRVSRTDFRLAARGDKAARAQIKKFAPGRLGEIGAAPSDIAPPPRFQSEILGTQLDIPRLSAGAPLSRIQQAGTERLTATGRARQITQQKIGGVRQQARGAEQKAFQKAFTGFGLQGGSINDLIRNISQDKGGILSGFSKDPKIRRLQQRALDVSKLSGAKASLGIKQIQQELSGLARQTTGFQEFEIGRTDLRAAEAGITGEEAALTRQFATLGGDVGAVSPEGIQLEPGQRFETNAEGIREIVEDEIERDPFKRAESKLEQQRQETIGGVIQRGRREQTRIRSQFTLLGGGISPAGKRQLASSIISQGAEQSRLEKRFRTGFEDIILSEERRQKDIEKELAAQQDPARLLRTAENQAILQRVQRKMFENPNLDVAEARRLVDRELNTVGKEGLVNVDTFRALQASGQIQPGQEFGAAFSLFKDAKDTENFLRNEINMTEEEIKRQRDADSEARGYKIEDIADQNIRDQMDSITQGLGDGLGSDVNAALSNISNGNSKLGIRPDKTGNLLIAAADRILSAPEMTKEDIDMAQDWKKIGQLTRKKALGIKEGVRAPIDISGILEEEAVPVEESEKERRAKLAKLKKFKPKFKNDAQTKAFGFARRLLTGGTIIDNLETESGGDLDKFLIEAGGIAAPKLPFTNVTLVPNRFLNKEEQSFKQATKNFVNALLRRESGAVISPSEFDNAEEQYFPSPGDLPETLAQKRENRQQVTEDLFFAGGNPDFLAIERAKIELKEPFKRREPSPAIAPTPQRAPEIAESAFNNAILALEGLEIFDPSDEQIFNFINR